MLRLLDLVYAVLRAIERLYGVLFLAIGGLLLYWGGRGLLAYQSGIRAAWSEPLACVAGLVAGVFSVWAGAHVVRRGIPATLLPGGRGASAALDATLEEAMELERTDPAAAQQLLDGYFMREATAKERRREELRRRAVHDVDAAVELRRELQDELEGNGDLRKDGLKGLSASERQGMLTEIDASDRQLQSELLQLDRTIEQLKLR